MSGLTTNTPVSLIDPNRASAGSAKVHASNLTGNAGRVQDQQSAALFSEAGSAVGTLQSQIDTIMKVLRANIPQPATYLVLDPNGNPIAWIGYAVVNNVVYQGGWFKQFYVGGSDAAHAVISTDTSGNVTVTNAKIVLTGSAGTITLDPTGPVLTVYATATHFQVRVQNGVLHVEDLTTTDVPNWTIEPSAAVLVNSTGAGAIYLQLSGSSGYIQVSGGGGSNTITLDGTTGNMSATGNVNGDSITSTTTLVTGTSILAGTFVNAVTGYEYNGTAGTTTNIAGVGVFSFTTASVLTGTPAAGQSLTTVVNSVSLTTAVHQVLGGIVTT